MSYRCPKCGLYLQQGVTQCPLCHEYLQPIQPVASTADLTRISNTNGLILYQDQGSSIAGFLLVFFFGFPGLIIALAINKRRTNIGAWIGIILHTLLLIAIIVALVINWSKIVDLYMQIIQRSQG